jgi:FxsC-like protein
VHSDYVPAATPPYFFLSYAHTPRLNSGDPTDPDLWVADLFRDLCQHVMQITDLPKGANPGFMDRDLRPGDDWPMTLVQALATCRVFVPLYSPRYFTSAQCGKEWFYFTRRALNHATRVAGPVEAIIPAIWSPVGLHLLPEVARSIQLDYGGHDPYSQYGFWGIMKLSRYRNDYEEAVFKLADRIVTVAQRSPVREGLVADYDSLESAFGGEEARTMPGDQRLRITIVAPQQSALPEGRDGDCYGPTARDWNPYAPDAVRPIADHAAALARGLGYRVDLGDLYQHEADLLSGGPPSGPQVLIIDPWATMLPRCQHLLQRLDALEAPWVQVVIPWNRRDGESPEAEGKLRVALDASMRRKITEVRSTSAIAVHGVPTLDEFSQELPKLILTAVKQYLKHARAFPPAGPPVERPRLSGFLADPATPVERSDG